MNRKRIPPHHVKLRVQQESTIGHSGNPFSYHEHSHSEVFNQIRKNIKELNVNFQGSFEESMADLKKYIDDNHKKFEASVNKSIEKWKAVRAKDLLSRQIEQGPEFIDIMAYASGMNTVINWHETILKNADSIQALETEINEFLKEKKPKQYELEIMESQIGRLKKYRNSLIDGRDLTSIKGFYVALFDIGHQLGIIELWEPLNKHIEKSIFHK